MSEAGLLSLVERDPHPTALARRVRDGSLFAGLHRLEAHGLLTRRCGEYRLTDRGRDELALIRSLARLIAQGSSTNATSST
jgi:DNA-binding PadR family transcriptional regulator